MSSDKFNFIVLEIPEDIDHSMIERMRELALGISLKDALNINELLDLEPIEVSGEALREGDLFEIGNENLHIKKAVHDFLDESISKIIVPRLYSENRISSCLGAGGYSYITIRGKPYVISGQQSSYYNTKVNVGYKYILALSTSNILESFIAS